MQKINIEDIKVSSNVRKDYGDLVELTDSIMENGVLQPLELGKDNVLIDGYRRLKAAKLAKLEEVPVFHSESNFGTQLKQIIYGMHNKNLNPIEEGNAFKKAMKDFQYDIIRLCVVVSKSKLYVERRLALINLPETIKVALITGKIQMGHGLVLARIPKGESEKYMREIVRDKLTVEQSKENLTYGRTKRISEACFDTKECKNCKYNGSKQAELFETGRILTGECLNPACYGKKRLEFVKNFKKENKDILQATEELPIGYYDLSRSYGLSEKNITKAYIDKCKKNREGYLVYIDDRGEVTEYIKIPESKKTKTVSKEKQLDTKRKEVLGNRIEDYKRDFLIDKSKELIKPGTVQVKVLAIREMGMFNMNVETLLKTEGKELDKVIKEVAGHNLYSMDQKDLIKFSKSVGVDMKKHFKITEEFLQLHTKDQLIALGKEFKIKVMDEVDGYKKKELIKTILELVEDTDVPRSVL